MPEFRDVLDELVPPVGVFAYLGAPADTTCTLADTWYPINGAFTNDPMLGFEVDVDKLKYIGAKTMYFEIDGHIVVKGDSNGTTAHFGLKKTGAIIPSSVMGTYMKTLNEPFPVSGTTVVELATNDTIQLVMKADGAGDIITTEHLTTTIRPFGR